MNNKTKYTVTTLLSILLGFLGSIATVNFRTLAWPEGFLFPLQPVAISLKNVEIYHEIALLFFLVLLSMLLGKRSTERAGWFFFIFAVSRSARFLFLYLLSGWPSSLASTDLIGLFPTATTSPVWAFLVLSVLVIVLSILIITFSKRIRYLRFRGKELLFLIIGAAFCYASFITDKNFSMRDFSSKEIHADFNWILYTIGCVSIAVGILYFFFHNKKSRQK